MYNAYGNECFCVVVTRHLHAAQEYGSSRGPTTPQLHELSMEMSSATWKMVDAQQAMGGVVLNPVKLLGSCPTIAEV
jgi:hypothetical protein